jgi:hypothetical protein
VDEEADQEETGTEADEPHRNTEKLQERHKQQTFDQLFHTTRNSRVRHGDCLFVLHQRRHKSLERSGSLLTDGRCLSNFGVDGLCSW